MPYKIIILAYYISYHILDRESHIKGTPSKETLKFEKLLFARSLQTPWPASNTCSTSFCGFPSCSTGGNCGSSCCQDSCGTSCCQQGGCGIVSGIGSGVGCGTTCRTRCYVPECCEGESCRTRWCRPDCRVEGTCLPPCCVVSCTPPSFCQLHHAQATCCRPSYCGQSCCHP
ncbi:keratin-associated protein 9-3-like [Petaurus breviceps papuanus]|uniref:keratin-associated protein 9-3-like n=1 Tax=Petaurus breviceps papuanus TaxID=3040969 RepID=UPI0036DA03DC